MDTLSLSLWLPIGRANFYSGTTNGWLMETPVEQRVAGKTSETAVCRSAQIDDADYLPTLHASVLRRLLEVLPLSFGYDKQGVSNISDEVDEHDRPIDLEIALTPRHNALSAAGVSQVRLFVDEHGFYTFTADYVGGPGSRASVREALQEHMREVFGSAWSVNRLQERRTGVSSEGIAAVRRYSGLDELDPDRRTGPPMGILSFFQLNTIAEGLFNDTLSPAVFFEQYRFMKRYMEETEHGTVAAATTVLHTLGHVIEALTIEADTRDDVGQITTLHHFLTVSSREVLQKLKWSVESVRRGLLEEMMGVLHRQSRLIQLDLSGSPKERTPELAVDASESQLRGYVMLISAKLPLVRHVHELARLAESHISRLLSTHHDLSHRDDLKDLLALLNSWEALLKSLATSVTSLESAISQAWMERLLYEQEQARSEQEAMAEIERSHSSRPAGGRIGSRAYNSVMLMLTVVAVVITMQSTVSNPAAGLRKQILLLLPVFGAVAAFFVGDAIISTIRRSMRERRGSSQNYTYEFSFRLDERTNPLLVFDLLNDRRKRDSIWSTRLGRAFFVIPLRRLLITRVGGARIERISPDTTLVKFHVVATFRAVLLRYARFEVVTEVLASRVSEQPRYVLRQTRIFGDSPVPLKAYQLLEVMSQVVEYVGWPLAADGQLDDLLDLVESFYSREKLDADYARYGQEWLAGHRSARASADAPATAGDALRQLKKRRGDRKAELREKRRTTAPAQLNG